MLACYINFWLYGLTKAISGPKRHSVEGILILVLKMAKPHSLYLKNSPYNMLVTHISEEPRSPLEPL